MYQMKRGFKLTVKTLKTNKQMKGETNQKTALDKSPLPVILDLKVM